MLRKTILLLSFLLFSMSCFAQPDVSLWRVQDGHGDHGHNDERAEEPVFYPCGSMYYYYYQGGDFVMHLAVKNEGNAPLTIDRLYLEESSVAEWTITNNHKNTVLQPGEEALLDLVFTDPGSYRDGMSAQFVIQSDAWTSKSCGLEIQTGNGSGEICVCTEGGPQTIFTNPPGVLFSSQQSIFISPGPCPANQECPGDDEVGCYLQVDGWVGPGVGQLFSDFKENEDEINMFGRAILVQDGYCPCELEGPTDNICIESPFFNDIIVIDVTPNGEENALPDVGPVPCSGEPFIVDTTQCSINVPPINLTDVAAIPGDYSFEWLVSGFGSATPLAPGDSARITDWIEGDYLILKITDDEGCLGVRSQLLRRPMIQLPLIEILPQQQGCSETSITICADEIDLKDVNVDRIIRTRGVNDFEWFVTGDAEILNQNIIDGLSCVEVRNFSRGDEIVVRDPTELNFAGCAIEDRLRFDFDFEQIVCQFFFNENILVREDPFRFDDPCNCSDPQNYMAADGRTVFHDILTIEDFTGMGVQLTDVMDWYDDSENSLDGMTIDIQDGGPDDNDGMVNGVILYDFWHFENEQATATITDESGNGTSDEFSSSICAACIAIPTMGQWGLIILCLLFVIISSVVMLYKRKDMPDILHR